MVESEKKHELIIVSNRLPLCLKKVDGSYQSTLSSGGLVTALSGISNSVNVCWFGWPGGNIKDPEERKITADALTGNNAVGIFLDKKLMHDHYNEFSNGIIWPMLYYQSSVNFNEDSWKSCQRVNGIFANIVANTVSSSNLVWVHNYYLLLFPAYLRDRLKKQRKECLVGFTLYISFPAEDFWRALPVQKELLTGILACNLVGFHIDKYKQNFLECHRSYTGTFIVDIDLQKFENILRIRMCRRGSASWSRNISIGVDRLDYTKGLVQKLHGCEYFLQQHPDLKGKVTLIQIAIPSREDVKEYQDLEKELSTIVGKTNGEHSTPDWAPILDIHHSVPFTDLTALYRIADICLITSRCDGMNLVAAEYHTFNLSSAQQLSDSVYKAATMSRKEKEKLHVELEQFITINTSEQWTETFTKALLKYV
ncbi:hypothetical protein BDW62DRAFT_215528 [Aspergillus aurantiobrunneus]